MLKLNNPVLKRVGGVVGKVVLVLTAVGAFADVFANDAQARKIEELEKRMDKYETEEE